LAFVPGAGEPVIADSRHSERRATEACALTGV
jgi:hypothetical protein